MSKAKNVFERIALAVVGAASLTKTRKKQLMRELVEEGKMSQTEAVTFIQKASERIEAGKKDVASVTEKMVKRVLKELDIPTRSELMQIKKDMEKWARRK